MDTPPRPTPDRLTGDLMTSDTPETELTPFTRADLERVMRAMEGISPLPWEVETHDHHEKGCRCLGCYISTGCIVLTPGGRDCQEAANAGDTADGGCEEWVLPWVDATFAVLARTEMPRMAYTLGMLWNRMADLEKRDQELSALEAAGVDNWEGYSQAFAEDEDGDDTEAS